MHLIRHSKFYLQTACSWKTGTNGFRREFTWWVGQHLDHSQTVHDARTGRRLQLARPSLLGIFLEVDKLPTDFPARRDHHAGISKPMWFHPADL